MQDPALVWKWIRFCTEVPGHPLVNEQNEWGKARYPRIAQYISKQQINMITINRLHLVNKSVRQSLSRGLARKRVLT
jgi:hypothetical protein